MAERKSGAKVASSDLSEFWTRIFKIDVMLRGQQWVLPRRKKETQSFVTGSGAMVVAEPKAAYGKRINVIEEVDTKQSDFKIRDYKTVSETLKNDLFQPGLIPRSS